MQWIVRGQIVLGAPLKRLKVHIDKFLKGQLVKNPDVVVWNAAHFAHNQSHEGGSAHIVGATIRPQRW